MTLHERLQNAKSEEDIKDAYIKALGLKEFSKNLIDIQTKEIWFEAKDKNNTSTYKMFTQLLHYVQQSLNKGEEIPPFLCVIDIEKAAIIKTQDVLPFLEKKIIPWGKSGSSYTPQALELVSSYIGTYIVQFKIETHEEEFLNTVKTAIKTGEIIRTHITPDNLKQVFDKWVKMIGYELNDVKEEDYALLFFSDIMSDGTQTTNNDLPSQLLMKGTSPVFALGGKLYELNSKEGYRQFWAIYHRPPKEEYRNYLLERRDSLIPLDERSFKGAYYTPLNVVDKAYDKLTEALGENWQKNYIVWDMCCGVGNLEVKHSNPRNIYMSTLDAADIDVMKATKTCVAAQRFQYDYLNDDITDDGQIDYSLTNKVPKGLQEAIAEGKKILILINPPYAEAGGGIDGKKNKIGVEQTKINTLMKRNEIGYASKELFVQFLVRISIEVPTATIAMFSNLKYVNASNFEKFRKNWNANYLDGFIVHSRAFDGLKGEFPIGFLIWKTNNLSDAKKFVLDEIKVEVFDKNVNPIGEKKYFNLSNDKFLNNWIDKPKTNNELALPLSNAVTISRNPRIKKSCDNMIGYLYAGNNDLQHAEQETIITSSIYTGGNSGGLYILIENLWKVAVVYSVRRLVKPTWLNDRDQFLKPTVMLNEEFKNDCLIFMLFSRQNRTAGANNLDWNNKKWSLVNHFIPFTEEEVGAPDRFEKDTMVQYLKDKELSKEAKAVLSEGRKLWKTYFTQVDVRAVREELKLNRPDVGWYQVRKALQARNNSGDYPPVSFKPFEEAYKTLTEKLQPKVFEYGFLKQ